MEKKYELAKVNGGWINKYSNVYESIVNEDFGKYGITVYFVAMTNIDPIDGTSSVSYHNYQEGAYGQHYGYDFGQVILYETEEQAKRKASHSAYPASVHHKILK